MNSITENTVDLVNNYNLSSSQANCKIEISRDNKKIIRVCKNGKWIYLGSKYNVTRDINNILNKIKDTDSKTLIVIFGLASGEYINELVKYIKEDNKVLIVEPSIEIIKLFLKENDRNLLEDERIYLVNFSKKLRDLLSGIIKIENLYDMVPIIYLTICLSSALKFSKNFPASSYTSTVFFKFGSL